MADARRPGVLALALLAGAAAGPARAAGPPALEPPPPAAVAEGRALVERMKAAPRGPYVRLRWWCADGAVLPPEPYACREHGGGVQHAEYSADRRRLAELGWPAGTIVTPTSWEELWESEPRQARLRALPVERYLEDVDDGWVLRRARDYRGRVQVEDEERAGREHLLRLLGERDLVARELLLVRELARTLPHAGARGDRTREVRRLSQEVADAEASFEPLRVRIHTMPQAGDADAARRWAAEAEARGVAADVLGKAREAAAILEALYAPAGRAARLQSAAAAVARQSYGPEARRIVAEANAAGEPAARVARLAELLALVRREIEAGTPAPAALALLDLSLEAGADLHAAAFEALDATRRRSDLIGLAGSLVEAGWGVGLLSAGERQALLAALSPHVGAREARLASWLPATRALERAGAWAQGTVRHAFAEPLARYAALEPKAAAFPDDVLRGSPLLPLAEVAGRLARDAERLAGLEHRVLGRAVDGLAGLNPGVARGRLRVVGEGAGAPAALRPGDVAVLPRTVSELPPVAGIVSLVEGNVLSHVQMLARNLGIPNATAPPSLLAALAPLDGAEVLLAVSPAGSVVLEPVAGLPPRVLASLEQDRAAEAAGEARVAVPPPDLTVRRPLPLSELHAGLSGRVVGPKAANVGELARQFPGRVAPAIALPFGVFAEHAAGPRGPKERLDRAFALHRAGSLDEAALAAEVDAVRAQVEALALSPAVRKALEPLERELFGEPGSYGVFVRSDTNVEDLPGFTGAGLNRTIPHVVDPAAQRAAVPKVWASPFTSRSMAWRARILARPEEVYPSVLLMRSVPSTKSGVLVTADVATGGEGLTVATAWGVGGAVDGEEAEVVVLRPDGSTLLVTEAKSPWKRRLGEAGGVVWAPAAAGPVLTPGERDEVRRLAAEARERLAPAPGPDGRPLPWDIELGFVDGRLWLFQVRPLVERGSERAARAVAALVPPPGDRVERVDLTLPVAGPARAVTGAPPPVSGAPPPPTGPARAVPPAPGP